MCGSTWGPSSQAWSLTTGSGGVRLPSPTLISPPNGAVLNTNTPMLEWSPVSGAINYQVHIYGSGLTRILSPTTTQLTPSSLTANTT
jgi:hypothetical protein